MKPTQMKALVLLAAILLLPGGLLSPGASTAAPKAEKIVLPNKLILLVVEEHSLPVVTFQALVDSGSWRDPQGKEGLAYLTAKGLLLGSKSHSIEEMYKDLDFMGSAIEAACGKDFATLTLKSLKKDMDTAFEIFLDALTRPTFPEVEVKRETDNLLGTIQFNESQPEDVAAKAFGEALYIKGPYGHPVEGSKESVGTITRDAIADFHGKYYRPGVTTLAVVGDITAEEVKSKLIPLLSAWQDSPVPEEPFVSEQAQAGSTVKIDRAITQANIILGHRGIERSNEDYYALSVMNQILGRSGLTSRMATEIRVKRGLAYAVESALVPRKHAGAFEVVIQTKNATAREAIDLAVEQLKRIQKTPVSNEELEAAKQYLVGNFPLRFDTQEDIAALYNQMEYYGLGLDYPDKYPDLIKKITGADVLRVARTYLHPDECILVVVADLKAAGLE